MMLKDTIFSNGKYLNDFKIVTVTIDEIIEDDDICIYSNYLWPITFLMTNFEINNIGINKMIINYSGDNLKEDLKFLNDSYPQYEFSNPYLEYASSIDEIGKYLTLGLGVFSSFCLISTLLLLIVSSSLFVLDTSKEIGIYSLYGYEEKSVKRLYKIYSYIMSFYSFFISFFALFVIYFMINKGSYSISFSSPKVLVVPLLIMFVVSFVIGYISSSISTKSIFKQNSLSLIR
jgi:ABC-type antimicrobial peptide transport system permease subunit